tara:strand:+ start:563 stop:760 length:198 start_codon:yes stop_codon:yes gene_type:complete
MSEVNTFEVEQEVQPNLLKDLGIKGVIVGRLERAYGQVNLYEVEWANKEGTLCSRWFTAKELSNP